MNYNYWINVSLIVAVNSCLVFDITCDYNIIIIVSIVSIVQPVMYYLQFQRGQNFFRDNEDVPKLWIYLNKKDIDDIRKPVQHQRMGAYSGSLFVLIVFFL